MPDKRSMTRMMVNVCGPDYNIITRYKLPSFNDIILSWCEKKKKVVFQKKKKPYRYNTRILFSLERQI